MLAFQSLSKGCKTDYIRRKDGKVCGVEILTIDSKFEGVEINTPLQSIIPLEIVKKNLSKDDADNVQRQGATTLDEKLKNDSVAITKRRVAAQNAGIIRNFTDN